MRWEGDVQLERDDVLGRGGDVGRAEGELAVRATDDNLDHVGGNRGRGRVGGARVRRVGRGPGSGAGGDGVRHNCASGLSRNGRGAVVGSRPSGVVDSRGSRGGGRCGGSRGLELCADVERRLLEVGKRVGRAVGTTVDSEDHALATMRSCGLRALAAVEPEGFGLIAGHVKVSHGRCDQRDEYGRTSLTVTVHVGKLSVWLAATGMLDNEIDVKMEI